jgi:hypothetical protein
MEKNVAFRRDFLQKKWIKNVVFLTGFFSIKNGEKSGQNGEKSGICKMEKNPV